METMVRMEQTGCWTRFLGGFGGIYYWSGCNGGKKQTIGVVTTILVGAVVCYFIKNPTTLSDIGEKIMGVVLQ